MKRNAFTLIELLAVIVILAIISLIAVPIVMGIINESKISLIKETTNSIYESAKLYITKNSLPNKEIKKIEIECKNNGCLVKKAFDANSLELSELQSKNMNLELKGKLPFGEYNGNYDIKSALYFDGYCVKGAVNDVEKIPEDECIITTNESCFNYNENTMAITGYKCYKDNNEVCNGISPCPTEEQIVIPKKINNSIIKRINVNAFRSKKISSVNFNLLKDLELIDQYAFYDNLMLDLDLTNTKVKKIGQYAFNKCDQIEKVKLPKTLERIEQWAFRGKKIVTVDFSKCENLSYIGRYAFSFSPISGELDLSNTKITTIEGEGFAYNRFTKIKLPSTLTTIGKNAFCVSNNSSSYIESITIPSSVTSIGAGAFNGMYGIITKPREVIIESSESNLKDRFCENWDSIFGTGVPNKSLYCGEE